MKLSSADNMITYVETPRYAFKKNILECGWIQDQYNRDTHIYK